MTCTEDLLEEFLWGLKDDKFRGFSTSQYPIVEDYDLGFRLAHQGMNQDPKTKPHRIYVQPLGKGKSKNKKVSKRGSSQVQAKIHCDDPEPGIEKVREALMESFRTGELVVV